MIKQLDVPLAILKENASNQANNPYENGNQNVSSRYVENGSFARLKNISLGYDFTKYDFVKSIGIRSLRVYVSAENLVTVTKYSGYSPDLNTSSLTANSQSTTQGIDFGVYPLAKSINFGLNVGF